MRVGGMPVAESIVWVRRARLCVLAFVFAILLSVASMLTPVGLSTANAWEKCFTTANHGICMGYESGIAFYITVW